MSKVVVIIGISVILGVSMLYMWRETRRPTERERFVSEYQALPKNYRVSYVLANLHIANQLVAQCDGEADVIAIFGNPDIRDAEKNVWAWLSRTDGVTQHIDDVWANAEYYKPFFTIKTKENGIPLKHKLDTMPRSY